jgi:hypothetical protein
MHLHISIVKQKNSKFSLTLLLCICIRELRKIEGRTLEVFACTSGLFTSLELEMWVFCP